MMWKELSTSDKVQLIFSVVLAIAGVALLLSVDWRVAVAVFLLLWGNNVNRSVRGEP